MTEARPCIGITALMSKDLPIPFEKALGLVAAHQTSFCEIHPCVSPVRKEGDEYLVDQSWELGGTKVKFQTKFKVGRDEIVVDMSSIPLTGTAFIRFKPVEEGTQVFIECDFGDFDNNKHYDEKVLSDFVGKYLDSTYENDLRYMNAMSER